MWMKNSFTYVNGFQAIFIVLSVPLQGEGEGTQGDKALDPQTLF